MRDNRSLVLFFFDRVQTNWPVQSQKKAKDLRFCI